MRRRAQYRPWSVWSPTYETYGGSWVDPGDPPEYGCDVVEVVARTKREAIIKGVSIMRKQRRWYHESDENPYTGIKAEVEICPHGIWYFTLGPTQEPEYITCETCNAEAMSDDADTERHAAETGR